MSWFKRKVSDPLIGFLKQGITPSSLAWSITAGIIIAYIPIFGIATLLCLAAVWLFRLNPAAVLLANQLAYPLQFILFIPQLRAGESLFGAPHIPLSFQQIADMAREDFRGMFAMLWKSTLYGVVVWVLVSIPVAFLLHWAFRVLFERLLPKKSVAELRKPTREGIPHS